MGDVMNLGRLLSDMARRLPDRPGLVWRDRTWTWREIDQRVNALAAALRGLGVAKGDRVLVQSRNSNQMFETCWAVFKAGAAWVPTNYRLTPPEIAWLGQSSGAKAFIYDRGFGEHVDAVRAGSPALGHVIAVAEPRAGEHAYEALVAKHAGAPSFEEDVSYDDPVWFFFTSGTTGKPKAAVLTHGQMAYVVTNHLADLMPGLSEHDASLVVAPLSHGAGMHMLVNVARGARSVLLPSDKLDVEEAWRLVARHRVTNMFTVPTIVKMLVDDPAVDRYDHSSLRQVIYAGAPMYRADQKKALEKLGPVLVQYFGLGEVTGNITVLPPALHTLDDDAPDARIGTCGYPRTGMEIAIKDPSGRRLGPGEKGEICVRGPGVFLGYWNNPEANAKALKDGWFHTGDLGRLDAQGFLYITGRASDMYISGGANVYPRECEEVLLTHPAVSEVAVLGVPDPKWGESGVAVVVPAEGALPREDELLHYLDGRLAKYKWPRRVFFWPDLPKSGYGKVPKHLIRDQLYARGELSKEQGP
ncbi:MAG: acyl-CoA synthetase [Alphaproteobacteria bacterium]|nr:acyl-CoA synthetase [Alphaproteobacteria bacterium]